MGEFYNRTRELQALEERWDAGGAQFALLYGRRRLGKTYLLQHFFSGRPCCCFIAAQTTFQENLAQLAEEVLQAIPGTGYRPADFSTFNSILRFVGNHAKEQRFALVLDEFQYLLEQDPSIASQLQAWWDTDGIRSQVFIVLCGSHLGVMEGLGGAQAPLFGRFTFKYKLPPMNYVDIARFYAPSDYSIRDKLTAYAVLGGTPRYHALASPSQDLRSNICSLILSPLGLLHNEPEVLLLSSQVRDPVPYNASLRAIATGCTKFNEVAQRVGASSPQLSFYLRGLSELEWIGREYPFDETSDRRAIYRITDNFLRFWYRFIAGMQSELEYGDPREIFQVRIEPKMNDYVGRLAFEDICHQYLRIFAQKKHGLQICRAGRYWSRDGAVEIDVMAELDGGSYLFGECKWSSSPIGLSTYYELREKVARLPSAKYREHATFAMFSLVGFHEDMTGTAARDGVILVSGENLLA